MFRVPVRRAVSGYPVSLARGDLFSTTGSLSSAPSYRINTTSHQRENTFSEYKRSFHSQSDISNSYTEDDLQTSQQGVKKNNTINNVDYCNYRDPSHPAYPYIFNEDYNLDPSDPSCCSFHPSDVFFGDVESLFNRGHISEAIDLFHSLRDDYLLCQERHWAAYLDRLITDRLEYEFLESVTYLLCHQPVKWTHDPRIVFGVFYGLMRFNLIGCATAILVSNIESLQKWNLGDGIDIERVYNRPDFVSPVLLHAAFSFYNSSQGAMIKNHLLNVDRLNSINSLHINSIAFLDSRYKQLFNPDSTPIPCLNLEPYNDPSNAPFSHVSYLFTKINYLDALLQNVGNYLSGSYNSVLATHYYSHSVYTPQTVESGSKYIFRDDLHDNLSHMSSHTPSLTLNQIEANNKRLSFIQPNEIIDSENHYKSDVPRQIRSVVSNYLENNLDCHPRDDALEVGVGFMKSRKVENRSAVYQLNNETFVRTFPSCVTNIRGTVLTGPFAGYRASESTTIIKYPNMLIRRNPTEAITDILPRNRPEGVSYQRFDAHRFKLTKLLTLHLCIDPQGLCFNPQLSVFPEQENVQEYIHLIQQALNTGEDVHFNSVSNVVPFPISDFKNLTSESCTTNVNLPTIPEVITQNTITINKTVLDALRQFGYSPLETVALIENLRWIDHYYSPYYNNPVFDISPSIIRSSPFVLDSSDNYTFDYFSQIHGLQGNALDVLRPKFSSICPYFKYDETKISPMNVNFIVPAFESFFLLISTLVHNIKTTAGRSIYAYSAVLDHNADHVNGATPLSEPFFQHMPLCPPLFITHSTNLQLMNDASKYTNEEISSDYDDTIDVNVDADADVGVDVVNNLNLPVDTVGKNVVSSSNNPISDITDPDVIAPEDLADYSDVDVDVNVNNHLEDGMFNSDYSPDYNTVKNTRDVQDNLEGIDKNEQMKKNDLLFTKLIDESFVSPDVDVLDNPPPPLPYLNPAHNRYYIPTYVPDIHGKMIKVPYTTLKQIASGPQIYPYTSLLGQVSNYHNTKNSFVYSARYNFPDSIPINYDNLEDFSTENISVLNKYHVNENWTKEEATAYFFGGAHLLSPPYKLFDQENYITQTYDYVSKMVNREIAPLSMEEQSSDSYTKGLTQTSGPSIKNMYAFITFNKHRALNLPLSPSFYSRTLHHAASLSNRPRLNALLTHMTSLGYHIGKSAYISIMKSIEIEESSDLLKKITLDGSRPTAEIFKVMLDRVTSTGVNEQATILQSMLTWNMMNANDSKVEGKVIEHYTFFSNLTSYYHSSDEVLSIEETLDIFNQNYPFVPLTSNFVAYSPSNRILPEAFLVESLIKSISTSFIKSRNIYSIELARGNPHTPDWAINLPLTVDQWAEHGVYGVPTHEDAIRVAKTFDRIILDNHGLSEYDRIAFALPNMEDFKLNMSGEENEEARHFFNSSNFSCNQGIAADEPLTIPRLVDLIFEFNNRYFENIHNSVINALIRLCTESNSQVGLTRIFEHVLAAQKYWVEENNKLSYVERLGRISDSTRGSTITRDDNIWEPPVLTPDVIYSSAYMFASGRNGNMAIDLLRLLTDGFPSIIKTHPAFKSLNPNPILSQMIPVLSEDVNESNFITHTISILSRLNRYGIARDLHDMYRTEFSRDYRTQHTMAIMRAAALAFQFDDLVSIANYARYRSYDRSKYLDFYLLFLLENMCDISKRFFSLYCYKNVTVIDSKIHRFIKGKEIAKFLNRMKSDHPVVSQFVRYCISRHRVYSSQIQDYSKDVDLRSPTAIIKNSIFRYGKSTLPKPNLIDMFDIDLKAALMRLVANEFSDVQHIMNHHTEIYKVLSILSMKRKIEQETLNFVSILEATKAAAKLDSIPEKTYSKFIQQMARESDIVSLLCETRDQINGNQQDYSAILNLKLTHDIDPLLLPQYSEYIKHLNDTVSQDERILIEFTLNALFPNIPNPYRTRSLPLMKGDKLSWYLRSENYIRRVFYQFLNETRLHEQHDLIQLFGTQFFDNSEFSDYVDADIVQAIDSQLKFPPVRHNYTMNHSPSKLERSWTLEDEIDSQRHQDLYGKRYEHFYETDSTNPSPYHSSKNNKNYKNNKKNNNSNYNKGLVLLTLTCVHDDDSSESEKQTKKNTFSLRSCTSVVASMLVHQK